MKHLLSKGNNEKLNKIDALTIIHFLFRSMQLTILASRSSVCFAFYEKTSYVQNLAYFL